MIPIPAPWIKDITPKCHPSVTSDDATLGIEKSNDAITPTLLMGYFFSNAVVDKPVDVMKIYLLYV